MQAELKVIKLDFKDFKLQNMLAYHKKVKKATEDIGRIEDFSVDQKKSTGKDTS